MNATELRATDRAAITCGEALELLPLSLRSLGRALEPGGDLEDVALRVGRRVFLKVEPLRVLLGLHPDMDEAGSTNPARVTTHGCKEPQNHGRTIRAV